MPKKPDPALQAKLKAFLDKRRETKLATSPRAKVKTALKRPAR